MDWRAEGILLSVRKHGETAAIIEVLTEAHGRHAGVVRGGTSRKIAPILQPGAQLDLSWRARLDEHIGTFTVEPVRSRAATLMGSRLTLAGLNAITGLLSFALPEREAHPRLYAGTLSVLDMMGESEFWPLAYVRWEMALLEDLGFALDLATCAVTGQTDDLIYVSPKSGRAVSAKGAGEWEDRMLRLSPALVGQGGLDDVASALRTTGHFLETRLAHSLGSRPLPAARARLLDLLARQPSA